MNHALIHFELRNNLGKDVIELLLWIITASPCRYEVYCDSHNTHGVVGLTLNLITQTSKHR